MCSRDGAKYAGAIHTRSATDTRLAVGATLMPDFKAGMGTGELRGAVGGKEAQPAVAQIGLPSELTG